MTEPISPSVWRRAKRNTARRVKAVRMARGEPQGCPPRVVRGSGGARLGGPGSDRLIGEPDRQAATLAQAGGLSRPVRDVVLLPGNVASAGLVQLERQDEHPRSDEGRRPTPPRPQHQPPSRSMQHSLREPQSLRNQTQA